MRCFGASHEDPGAVEATGGNEPGQGRGHVSHELRTPLTMIIGNASILLRAQDQLDKISRKETLTDIVASGERLQRMIENLLALARAQAKVEAPDKPTMVRHVARDLIDSHRRRHPERQINLLNSREATPIICARESLEQVVDNFLTNAEKYSPASPSSWTCASTPCTSKPRRIAWSPRTGTAT